MPKVFGKESFGKEFVAGSIAGGAGVFVGHPLDTVKTRLQTSTSYASWTQCFGRIARKEGTRAFFRGLSWPFFSKAIEQCLIFGLNEKFRRILPLEGDSLVATSGALAGVVGMGILTPVYVVKVQLQISPKERIQAFSGPLQCASFNLKTHGIRHGLYAGFLPSLVANPICYGIRFITYTKCQDAVSSTINFILEDEKGSSSLPSASSVNDARLMMSQMISGGIAGMMTWGSVYPLDVVMSKMQAQGAQRRFQPQSEPYTKMNQGLESIMSVGRKGMWWHAKDLYNKGGLKAFFKGLEPCLLRAFPVNAIMFLTYEQTVKLL